MEICEEIISNPYIKYKVKVSHVTSRNSIAFEWLFLEALIRTSNTEYQSENLYDFFRNYFLIDNPEKLIMPILKRLYDLQAVSCSKLSDDISLSDLQLSDIEVLPIGKEMQKKGLLPGEKTSDVIELVYDVLQKKLCDRNNFDSEAKGIYKSLPEEPIFPEKVIRDYIESARPHSEAKEDNSVINNENTDNENAESKKAKKKGKKNKGKKFDWLKDNTEIDKLIPSNTEICFDNIPRKVQLNDGLVWKIESNKDIELDKRSLEKFENDAPAIFSACPETKISKPDSEITQIVLFKDLNSRIKQYIKNNRISILNASLFNIDRKENNKKNNGKNETSLIILDAAQEFSIRKTQDNVIVTVPEKIIPSNCLYMNEKFLMQVEAFPIKAGDFSKKITFAYLPKNVKSDINNVLIRIVDKYYEKNAGVLLLLNESDVLKKEFDKYLDKLVSNGSIKDKGCKIDELNKLSSDLTGKKIISEEIIYNLLVDKAKIAEAARDFTSAKKIIEEYSSIPVMKNQVFRDFLKIVCDEVKASDSLEEIWSFIDFIARKASDAKGYLDKQNSLIKLYSDKAKNAVCKLAFENKLEKAHCYLEERFITLSKLYKEIKTEQKAKKQKELINTWRNTIKNVKNKFGSIHELELNDDVINLYAKT